MIVMTLFIWIYASYTLAGIHNRDKIIMIIRINTVNMKDILLIIWMCVSFNVGQVATQIKNVTACYPGCSFYNMTCQKKQMIQITEAEYRYRKNPVCNMDDCGNGCCPVDKKDRVNDFSEFHATTLYQRCSGKDECINKQAPDPPEISLPPEDNKNTRGYVHMSYECIEEVTFIDICDTTKMNFSKVNIMLFNKTWLTDGVSRCICHVQSNKTVNYQLVDVRFFVASTDKHDEYNCTSGTLTINELFIKCNKSVNKMFVYMKSTNFSGELKNDSDLIQFTYNKTERPSMLWINLRGSNGIFWINCTNESSTNAPILTTTPSAVDTIPSKTSTPAPIVTITQSAVDTIPSKSNVTIGQKDGAEQLSIVLPVVGAVIIIIAVAVTIFIVYRRRCRKPVEKDTFKNDLPNGQTNPGYESVNDSDMSYPAVETSNYDSINDESIVTYSKPVKRTEDIVVAKNENKFDEDVSTDEYDKIEFGKKCIRKASNYDILPAKEGKVHDDTYSHLSSQPKSISSVNANKYSHCKNGKTILPSDDISNKATVSDKSLGDGDYSHVDLDAERKKEMPSNVHKLDPYNHINFDKTTISVGIEKAEKARIMPETEKASPAFTDLKSPSQGSERCFTGDVATKVSSKESHLQEIKALSLNDNNIEFKDGDMYDTPVSKEKQYAVFLKTKKEQRPNEVDTRSKVKFGLDNSTIDAQESENNSDYELAKPLDL